MRIWLSRVRPRCCLIMHQLGEAPRMAGGSLSAAAVEVCNEAVPRGGGREAGGEGPGEARPAPATRLDIWGERVDQAALRPRPRTRLYGYIWSIT